ncbi:MAG: glycosyltransferase family 39 protein [Anaerolineae bacterium]|nr:glycosyltransferase family 39 protein [Anaerolineae bacterium]
MTLFRPRDMLFIGLIGLAVGLWMASRITAPGYTDAYYYFNAGQRLVAGHGLTDAALWTYLGNPQSLPAPSHLYWMPLTSLIAAAGMALGGPTFDAAQVPFALLYALLGVIGYATGALLGKTRRVAWLAGLITLFSGFFMPYWTTTATFAPFGVVGSLCLLAIGVGRRTGDWRAFAAAGALAGLAHLTRADGLLFVAVMGAAAVWPGRPPSPLAPLPRTTPEGTPVRGRGEPQGGSRRGQTPPLYGTPWRGGRGVRRFTLGLFAYLLVMAPWFVRNLGQTGALLPAGGLDTAWMRTYDEIANYPPGVSFQSFLDWGVENILRSRWDALVQNLQRFVAEQGLIVLAPLLLIGLWRRRFDPLLGGVGLYALGLHLLMTLVFALPGPRGGLFHSAAALVPFWAALGVLGLDDVIGALARLRRWKVAQARAFFGGALLCWAVFLSLWTFGGKSVEWSSAGQHFAALDLPPDAVAASNDPPALYYFRGAPGVVLPNAPPERLLDLAARYGVNYVIVDANRTPPLNDLWEGQDAPPFLQLVYSDESFRVYRIEPSPPAPLPDGEGSEDGASPGKSPSLRYSVERGAGGEGQ